MQRVARTVIGQFTVIKRLQITCLLVIKEGICDAIKLSLAERRVL